MIPPAAPLAIVESRTRERPSETPDRRAHPYCNPSSPTGNASPKCATYDLPIPDRPGPHRHIIALNIVSNRLGKSDGFCQPEFSRLLWYFLVLHCERHDTMLRNLLPSPSIFYYIPYVIVEFLGICFTDFSNFLNYSIFRHFSPLPLALQVYK